MTDQTRNFPALPDLPVGTVADVSPDDFQWFPAIRTADGWLANAKPEEFQPGMFTLVTAVHVWTTDELYAIQPSRGTWDPAAVDAMNEHRRALADLPAMEDGTTHGDPLAGIVEPPA